jgi:hypothetical protein
MDYYDDDIEEQISKKDIELIDKFTIKDYFSCQHTRNILLDQWSDDFYNNLEESIKENMEINKQYLTNKSTNILYKLDDNHVDELLNIIKYHVKKDYDISIFNEYPQLAKPLIYKHNNQKTTKIDKNESTKENFKKYNKKHVWGNNKK